MNEVPFTSGQVYLLEELEAARPRWFDTPIVVPVERRPEPGALRQALETLVARHDALRLRLHPAGHRWTQTIVPEPGVELDWARLDDPAGRPALVVDACRRLHEPGAPLIRFLYVESGEGDALCAVVNHFVSDGTSVVLLSGELRRLVEGAALGRPVRVPPPTASFAHWARRIAAHVESPEADREVRDYWLHRPWDRVRMMPLDFDEGRVRDPVSGRFGYGTTGSQREVTAELSPEDTSRWLLPGENEEDERYRVNDLLLTAILLAFAALYDASALYIFDTDSGRGPVFEGLSLRRTVGFIAHGRRLLVDLEGAATPEAALAAVRAQLRAMPSLGRTLEWLIHRGDGRPVRADLDVVPRFCDISLNYRGWLDPWLETSGTTDLPELAAENDLGLRNHPLNLDAAVIGGRFVARWTYSTQVHRGETIERLAETCRDVLARLIQADRGGAA